MKIIKLLVLILLPLCSCHHHTSPSVDAFDEVLTERFSKKMKKTEGFLLSGFGGARFPKIRVIHLSYNVKRRLTLEKARILLVESVTKLMEEVNESEKLRPHLDPFPYSIYGIHFTLFFKDDKLRQLTDGSIARISLLGFKDPERANVIYTIYIPEKDDWEEYYRESWQEAERIVNGYLDEDLKETERNSSLESVANKSLTTSS